MFYLLTANYFRLTFYHSIYSVNSFTVFILASSVLPTIIIIMIVIALNATWNIKLKSQWNVCLSDFKCFHNFTECRFYPSAFGNGHAWRHFIASKTTRRREKRNTIFSLFLFINIVVIYNPLVHWVNIWSRELPSPPPPPPTTTTT